MDIEGAEEEVLQDYRSWIGRVDSIIVELHGTLRTEGSPQIQKIERNYNFRRETRGENVVLNRYT
jgi:hypothetical protein